MKRSNPWCEFECSPDELVRAVCFGDIEQMANELGMPAQELAYVCPATGERINYEEVAFLSEYRNARRLAAQQADLIERLMTQRNFYRDNCHRQARFGMLLNRLLGDD
ncbi:hypothetical protein [Chromobacterium haemolyticum]|uniref:hypothetical protein n=1 Tax=Chromobacterium TaxID=535 RepID=UPI00405652AA